MGEPTPEFTWCFGLKREIVNDRMATACDSHGRYFQFRVGELADPSYRSRPVGKSGENRDA